MEIAELTKVVENAHRYLQIAFAEEIYLQCQVNNVNFPELREALNTKWKVDLNELKGILHMYGCQIVGRYRRLVESLNFNGRFIVQIDSWLKKTLS